MIISIEVNRTVDINLVNQLIEKLNLKKIDIPNRIRKLFDSIGDLEFDVDFKKHICSECGEESNVSGKYCKYCEEKTMLETTDYEAIYEYILEEETLEMFLENLLCEE